MNGLTEMLCLIPAAPLLGFLLLALFGGRLARGAVSAIGVGSVALSATLALLLSANYIGSPPADGAITQTLWTVFSIHGLHVDAALRLDALSVVMVLVITVVGFLIHLYSTAYMREDASYSRFFAYMNLFVASMLTLVLADNLFLLFLGWEGVGLCSYLLIGFWYSDAKNGRAAQKAFIVTRVGDVAMAIGLFYLIAQFGTLHIATILERAASDWAVGSTMAVTASLLLLGGALGKSGQVPLQVWLPDAMAGPTPVSALIHAATMVTAGVYLIARMHGLFTLAPSVMCLVAVIGAVTLLLAGGCALAQRDIKRVLAYSTISQIGYMFLALGVGAWSAAMFHFMTHAIFKALLFMAAGAIILALHHEQDMFKMGGLRKRMPLVFWTFTIGALSLSALPLISAGFYSKDMILYAVWSSPQGGRLLWAAGVVGAFITAAYTFRMVFITFFGEEQTHPHQKFSVALHVPLIVLAIGATVAGLLELPRTLGHSPTFSHFLTRSLPGEPVHGAVREEMILQAVAAGVVLLGIGLAYVLWYRRNAALAAFTEGAGRPVHRLASAGWGFDWVYDRLLVLPYVSTARANAGDFFDAIYAGVTRGSEVAASAMLLTQTGRLRWYLAWIGIGVAIAIGLVVYV